MTGEEEIKIKAQIGSKRCKESLAQPKTKTQKDPDWYSESYNRHFEVMKQMNDMTNKLKEEGEI